MMEELKLISHNVLQQLSELPNESKTVIILDTAFNPSEKLNRIPPFNFHLSDNSINLISECVRLMQFGGLLFVYGLPHQLALWGEHLSNLRDEKSQMLFKYWITLDIDVAQRNETLEPTSLGLLMFLKSKVSSQTPSPFHLNTSTVRVPHANCLACGQNVKDWGGKKHLMNPNGIALSDVWRDFSKTQIQNNVIPDFVLNRILALTRKDGATYLHIVQNESSVYVAPQLPIIKEIADSKDEWKNLSGLELNKVYQGDCIKFLERVSTIYPDGIFDLAFADPPYNLKKCYDRYEDALAEEHYINWCNRWLEGLVKTLKPGGSLFVLNLPKWAIHHAAYLNRNLEFRHWITWDALSDPRGKLMPAHYALLYYTKPGANFTFNYSTQRDSANRQKVSPPDSPQYCLRASCIKKRKKLGDDIKSGLSDVWVDIHRIKHKRDRDAHPCQLPEKLMERIILLTTNPNGLVFDPFCGAGTTALAAAKLDRNFVTIDLDPNYVRIAEQKLESMKAHADLFGIAAVPRQSVRKPKAVASKKEIETYLQRLALQLGKEPTEKDIEADNADMLRKIDLVYPNRLAAIKTCRVALRTLSII